MGKELVALEKARQLVHLVAHFAAHAVEGDGKITHERQRLRIVAFRYPLHLPCEVAQVGLGLLERPGHETPRRAPPGEVAARQGVGVRPDFRRRPAQFRKALHFGQAL